MKRASRAFQINKRLAEHSWGRLSSRLVTSLRSLTSDLQPFGWQGRHYLSRWTLVHHAFWIVAIGLSAPLRWHSS